MLFFNKKKPRGNSKLKDYKHIFRYTNRFLLKLRHSLGSFKINEINLKNYVII